MHRHGDACLLPSLVSLISFPSLLVSNAFQGSFLSIRHLLHSLSGPISGMGTNDAQQSSIILASEVWCMVTALTKNGYRNTKLLMVIWGTCDIHSQGRSYSLGQGLTSLQVQLKRRSEE